MAFFTHRSDTIIRYAVEQFKIELNFERFNSTFYNKNFFFNC